MLASLGDLPKFRDRFAAFLNQLDVWGHAEPDTPNATASPKHIVQSFARCNTDLLYLLPAREVHLFAKKFKSLPPRSLDRKVRSAASRLTNLYVDFQTVPGFNGSPVFRDVLRLLLFVSQSDFQELEGQAPGIVGSSNDLLPEILLAAAQAPSEAAQLEHATQLQAIMIEAGEWARRRDHYKPTSNSSYAFLYYQPSCLSACYYTAPCVLCAHVRVAAVVLMLVVLASLVQARWFRRIVSVCSAHAAHCHACAMWFRVHAPLPRSVAAVGKPSRWSPSIDLTCTLLMGAIDRSDVHMCVHAIWPEHSRRSSIHDALLRL